MSSRSELLILFLVGLTDTHKFAWNFGDTNFSPWIVLLNRKGDFTDMGDDLVLRVPLPDLRQLRKTMDTMRSEYFCSLSFGACPLIRITQGLKDSGIIFKTSGKETVLRWEAHINGKLDGARMAAINEKIPPNDSTHHKLIKVVSAYDEEVKKGKIGAQPLFSGLKSGFLNQPSSSSHRNSRQS